MRNLTIAVAAGATLVALAACGDSVASRLAGPSSSGSFNASGGAPSLSRGESGKSNNEYEDKSKHQDDANDQCEASSSMASKISASGIAKKGGDDDRDAKSKYKKGGNDDKDSKAKRQKGTNDDHEDADDECRAGSTVKKTLVDVVTIDAAGRMVPDPTWHSTGKLVIPRGETRWLAYRVDYSIANGGSGTLSEDPTAVCNTLGSGFHCSFDTGGTYSWSVQGTGSKTIQIDLTNNSRCDSQDFTNTVRLTPTNGTAVTASTTTTLTLTCPPPPVTVTKTLVHVSTMVNGQMVEDPVWRATGAVVIPVGETRWVDYRIDYVLPTGVTGTLTEELARACSTAGAGIECTAMPGTSWTVSGSGSQLFTIDLKNAGACGDRVFTNYATVTPQGGSPVTGSTSVTVKPDCVKITKTLLHVSTMVNGQMVEDPVWRATGTIVIPRGQIRWVDYRVDWVMPSTVSAVIRDDLANSCLTAGPGVECTSPQINPWEATGSGSRIVTVDIHNVTGCGEHNFVNTVLLSGSFGQVSGSSTSRLSLNCQ